jgi:hypothetical protein
MTLVDDISNLPVNMLRGIWMKRCWVVWRSSEAISIKYLSLIAIGGGTWLVRARLRRIKGAG